MCGILFLNAVTDSDVPVLDDCAETLEARGPDMHRREIVDGAYFSFHRLAINDISENGMQPFTTQDFVVICNGEIYNFHELRKLVPTGTLSSTSDCEILGHLAQQFGFRTMLSMVQGVFAIVYFDRRSRKFFVARDAIGIKSLYVGVFKNRLVFASELKALSCATSATMFPAGHFYSSESGVTRKWVDLSFDMRSWPSVNVSSFSSTRSERRPWQLLTGAVPNSRETIKENLHRLVSDAVLRRVTTIDRPLGCFLSGGLDSSIVAALVKGQLRPNQTLKTFSVGRPNATDLAHARDVAKWIGSEHHELVVTAEEMLRAIPRVIERIESYDVTTVRASTGMVLLSDWIKENTDVTVVFSGEGADELSGSYRYFDAAPSHAASRDESRRLVRDLQFYDVLRCDKSVSGSGLEARTPFLDMRFVDFYMRLPPEMKSNEVIEKQLLRETFEPFKLLPESVLMRKKEAFSDGCSSMEKPWFKIIQDYVDTLISDEEFAVQSCSFSHNKPRSKEELWYREIFERHFPQRSDVVPYIWRPRWSSELDPSARLLPTT